MPGTCVTVTIEGHRAADRRDPVAGRAERPTPTRAAACPASTRPAPPCSSPSASGPASCGCYDKDVFLATVAGMRVSDPGADLAVCLAVVSAAQNQPVPLDLIAIGEVALSGDVRPVPMLAERVAEAARLGFRRLLVPPGSRRAARTAAGSAPRWSRCANLDERDRGHAAGRA